MGLDGVGRGRATNSRILWKKIATGLLQPPYYIGVSGERRKKGRVKEKNQRRAIFHQPGKGQNHRGGGGVNNYYKTLPD